MYLVGDRVNFPSAYGEVSAGTIELIDEAVDGSINYVINSDNGQIVIRNSDDDDEMSPIDQLELDFS